MKKIILIFSVLFLNLFSQNSFALAPGELIRTLPVQDGGRIKPYDSFARETLELIYGKQSYKRNAEDSRKEPAYLIVMSFILAPESWVQMPLFEVNHLDVKTRLGLPADGKHFKGDEIFKKEEFANLMQELSDKRESKEKLTPYFQALQRLENQLMVFRELTSGRLLRVTPAGNLEAQTSAENTADTSKTETTQALKMGPMGMITGSEDGDKWLSLAELPADLQPYFVEISQKFAQRLGEVASNYENKKNETTAAVAFDDAVLKFQKAVGEKYPDQYVHSQKTSQEVAFNDIHPFRWAYIFYLLAAVVLLFVWIRSMDKGMTIVWSLVAIGFLIHTAGFGFRVYLSGRAPVTNMYETVVWMSWGAILFAMILEKLYKFKLLLLAGCLVGIVGMVIADSAPAVLDPSIQPLEAVLRSNYWLTVHVMTITISYSAFALAWGLGNLGLIYYALSSNSNAQKYADPIKKIATGVYRAMQIGVAFLAPGIILGGIWADYSWGRFWGWDPKETWALIALLGYIIVLHARIVNWLQNFGMIVSGVLTFSLVVMAWYGVNFVLGAGLHSYGFGAGGVEYVSAVVALQFLFVGYVAVARNFTITKA